MVKVLSLESSATALSKLPECSFVLFAGSVSPGGVQQHFLDQPNGIPWHSMVISAYLCYPLAIHDILFGD